MNNYSPMSENKKESGSQQESMLLVAPRQPQHTPSGDCSGLVVQPGLIPGLGHIQTSVVTQQPSSAAPNHGMFVPNCPRGLEYLSMIDQLLVHQQVELLEVFIGFETNNKYVIKNTIGQNVYYAVEDTDCCTRWFFGQIRPFDVKILDNYQNEVIHLYRPLKCQCCCCCCCLQRLEVSSSGVLLGTVEQEWTLCKPRFLVKNPEREIILRIKGPVCTASCGGDVNFYVFTKDGETKLGKISKQWSGLVREMLTDADNFGVTFPIDLDVRMKALLLGACFLIDFMFYENSESGMKDLL